MKSLPKRPALETETLSRNISHRGHRVTNPQPPTPNPYSRRRGVLLLVVLSLLVLFALISVTFVLIAGQYRRSSRSAARAEQYGDDPRKQLDEVFAQIVRDTNNTKSSLQSHSLLNDMYGNDGVRGTLSNTTPPANVGTASQFIDLTVTSFTYSLPVMDAQVKSAGFFNGCVLTMTSGPVANLSTRIVGYTFNGNYIFRVMAFDWPSTQVSTDFFTNNPPPSFIINGRPFNGTGFGFNTASPSPPGSTTFLDAPRTVTDPNAIPYALLPNGKYLANAGGYAALAGVGGTDEDYDAPDPQNMLLGYMSINPTGAASILPSLHRPDLYKYMQATYGNTVLRQVSLRPLQSDHPNFTGSNPTYSAVPTAISTWDVDNDGDGIADSVWVDVGIPVQTAPDGRRFKPLAAILCLDMDGRLNVNAHGNIAQADPNYRYDVQIGASPPPPGPTSADYLFSTTAARPTFLPSPAPPALPRGSGYGPAEINLSSVVANYQNFFKPTGIYEGRYGQLGAATIPLPGTVAGTGVDDILDSIKRFDVPTTGYYSGALSNYGSPRDVWGRAAMGVDYAGQPIYSFMPSPSTYPASATAESALGTAAADRPNDPYALNLSRRTRAATVSPTTNDNPFTATELERILRAYDIDASALPLRLQTFLAAGDMARTVTTDSFDLPSPGILPTADIITTLRAQNYQNPGRLPTSLHIVDLLRAKLIVGRGYPTNTALNATQVNQINSDIATMLPPELVAGVRFDLNRPFGNGVDDDGNNVVDEPSEYNTSKELPATWTSAFGASGWTGLDLNNDGLIDNNDLYARQQYAKYLYILMMLLSDQNYAWSTEVGVNQPEVNARRIAQWAINVVDFRDADSIMTPFEYDVNPFNGWSVDGILGSADDATAGAERRVVWGCEYPELLITEAFAMHDRRVKDTPTNQLLNFMPTPDLDMDQNRVPQGSLFIELYCPHNGNASMQSKYSQDLYDNSAAYPRLSLGKLAPVGAGGLQYPVWQIAITQSSVTTLNAANANNNVSNRINAAPDSGNFDPIPNNGGTLGPPNSLFGGATPVLIDRFIWFTNGAPNVSTADLNMSFYNKLGAQPLLSPSQYAVVGPRLTTSVGLTTGGTVALQNITFDTAAGTVTFTPANALGPNGSVTTFSALPIICSSAILPAGWPMPEVGLSITEPLPFAGYYPIPNAAGPGGTDTYSPALNLPQDGGSLTPAPIVNAPLNADRLWATQQKANYKTALLRRLANPLAAFDATVNPYITVDWQPIDLVVFNGEALQPPNPPNPKGDPDDLGFQTPPALQLCRSTERGIGSVDLWKTYISNNAPQANTQSSKGATAVFDYNLYQSLGYINKLMGTRWTKYTAATAPNYGYYNAPDPTTGGQLPFSWLTWNNRPFSSSAELLLVPATSAEQLLRQFSSTVSATNPYDATVKPAGFQAPFQQLLNFFLTSNGAATNSPYFYRLLEYVQVPSPFVGTETWLGPSKFSAPLAGAATEQALMSFYHPPFNRVSNYRDPGRVNINTIPGDVNLGTSTVWTNGILGILSGVSTAGQPNWQQIVGNRRGTVGLTGNPLAPTALPSFFANPFRSAGGAAFGLPGVPAPTSEVNVTVLRPDLNSGVSPQPPLFANANVVDYANPNRNPYFRYQPLERLSNLLTTRSNVYAVWITVGYFEVTSVGAPTPVYPDGYQLGQELGSDSGEITRHRAFYMYDRTIPVGFEPGKDHNFEKGILVKSYIELGLGFGGWGSVGARKEKGQGSWA